MLHTLVEHALSDFAMIGHAHGYHPGEVFFVERHFLNSQLESDTVRLSVTDAGLGNFNANSTCCHVITIQSFRHGATEPSHIYTFSYFNHGDGDFGPGHGLVITDDKQNMPYWRDIGQNPKTEWLLNELASNITDADGRYIFDGDPYNI